ncbi:MAG: hypothetical protein QM757_29830 [Paludibaculum sp.]
MVATRATTGPAAKLVVKADRRVVSANGEDVAVCVVEVQDAAGRILPVTENPVSFHVKGPGAVSGTGNGDPTNHEPDPGSTRKAFAGLCMAIVQSSKSPGEILVEATSPGLASASVVITSSAVTLRPQVPVWQPEVPSGTGISGLWRPAAAVAASTGGDPMALAGANADMVFTFRQEGNVLAGAVDSAAAGGFGGGPTGGPIQDGVVSDSKISFRAGATTYTGTIVGDRIELARSTAQRRFGGALAQPLTAARCARRLDLRLMGRTRRLEPASALVAAVRRHRWYCGAQSADPAWLSAVRDTFGAGRCESL